MIFSLSEKYNGSIRKIKTGILSGMNKVRKANGLKCHSNQKRVNPSRKSMSDSRTYVVTTIA